MNRANKKGMISSFFAIAIIIGLVLYFIVYLISIRPGLIEECSEDFTEYKLSECVNNLKWIKQCERFDAEWIRTRSSIFGPTIAVCIDKDGGIFDI